MKNYKILRKFKKTLSRFLGVTLRIPKIGLVVKNYWNYIYDVAQGVTTSLVLFFWYLLYDTF